MSEDLQDPEVGRNQLGDEPLVGVGGIAEAFATLRTLLETQIESLVNVVRSRSHMRGVAGLSARVPGLRTRLGGSGGSVELLGWRGGDLGSGEVLLMPL